MSGIPAGAGQLLGKRLGKFDILALLALGGTAEIYLARIGGAAGFEKYVVVKCLHDHLADDTEFVKMFLDEARLAAHLDHSNIVQTMELGEHDGRYYMVMEFLAGLSLAMIVRRAAERLPTGRIPVPLVLNLLAQSSAGLHYAHEKAMNGKALNIVHRDISPQNLVVSFEGVVKLVDFGIAKAELRETRTRSGTIKGKFAYMSPEQCVANNVDRRTDVFALGVIGHELLTGQRLFKRPSPYETYQAVMECHVRPPSMIDPALDPALDPVIMRAITKDKADRYPTAEAFGDALLSYLHHRGMGSSQGDVSRFFDAHFGQELEEHSGRMRELISGRDVSVDTGVSVSWRSNEPEEDREELAAMRASASSSGEIQGAIDSLGPAHEGPGALSLLLDDLGGGSRGDADDEMPADRTRIEANPMAKLNELERLSGRVPAEGAAVGPAGATRIVPSSAVPLPAPPPGITAGVHGPAGPPGSGKFPDAASMPTVIAESDAPIRPSPAPGAMPMGTPAPNAGSPQGLAQGYPVMNAEMSAQIATGATVFPSDPHRGPAAPPPGGMAMGPSPGTPGSGMPGPPMPMPMPGMQQPGMPPPGMPPGMGMHPQGMSPPGMHPPGMHPPGMPPPGMPPPGMGMHAQGMPPPGGPGPFGPSGTMPPPGFGPSGTMLPPGPMPGARGSEPSGMADAAGAGMISPVGQHYPENVDWHAVAARPARAVPPWLLAALFVGAIGIALLLTIVIARLAR